MEASWSLGFVLFAAALIFPAVGGLAYLLLLAMLSDCQAEPERGPVSLAELDCRAGENSESGSCGASGGTWVAATEQRRWAMDGWRVA